MDRVLQASGGGRSRRGSGTASGWQRSTQTWIGHWKRTGRLITPAEAVLVKMLAKNLGPDQDGAAILWVCR
jgi:hypothetical protein